MCIRDSNTTMAMLELGPIDALIALVGAVMIPFTISAMSTVVPNARASHVMEQGGEVLVRSMAYVLLVSMYGCVGLGAFYYYTLFLPFIAPGGPASLQWWLHVACSMYGLCKGNWDFVCCVFGSPNQWRWEMNGCPPGSNPDPDPVSYTHLRAHETPEHLVCRLLLEKKKKNTKKNIGYH
eukprot:TRINITY_DN24067_c0_g2_i1.p1 TRINITY_DN24067_c0_g2~~TRINITY_DN24067_c0_g2_i1.p1  ORF type:complete len:180 (+),score=52.82 TRINITY_DN24067_c0_g2_i1:155-694(+)